MHVLGVMFTLLVAIEHVYIMILEMFFSTSKVAQKTFGMSEEELENPRIKTLFANQGLYNGFLAAGLFWGIFFISNPYGVMIQLFFLSCVIIAAVYGAFTANLSILFKQGLPAMLAVLFIMLAM